MTVPSTNREPGSFHLLGSARLPRDPRLHRRLLDWCREYRSSLLHQLNRKVTHEGIATMNHTVKSILAAVGAGVAAAAAVLTVGYYEAKVAETERQAETCYYAMAKADRLVEALDYWGKAALVDKTSEVQHVDLWTLTDRAKLVNVTREAYVEAREVCQGKRG